MKTRRLIPIVGALTRPGDRSAGRWSPNGSPNLRLELGHQLEPTSLRTTEFAPAIVPQREQAASRPASPVASAPAAGYAPPTPATSWKTARFTGSDFPRQPDGTLQCPAGHVLHPQEQRREDGGSLRVVYAASIRDCRPCPLREQCQWNGAQTRKPPQVSMLLHPLMVGEEPLLWRDWSRREHRRACMQLVRLQRIEVSMPPPPAPSSRKADVLLSRPQRAHFRLSWTERLAHNARVPTNPVTIKLFGVPEDFATSLGLARAEYRLDRRWMPSSRTSLLLRVELHDLFF